MDAGFILTLQDLNLSVLAHLKTDERMENGFNIGTYARSNTNQTKK